MSRSRDKERVMTQREFWEKWMPEVYDDHERGEFKRDLQAVIRHALQERAKHQAPDLVTGLPIGED